MHPIKTIIIAGGSGLIGSAISKLLKEKHNYNIRVLSRQPNKIKDFEAYYWNPAKKEIDLDSLIGADVVINLAGTNIAGKRWTKRQKESIRTSRIAANHIFKEQLAKSPSITKYIAASAQGYYGDQGDTLLNESAKPTKIGFQSSLTTDWEDAIQDTIPPGMSWCILRTAVVMSMEGGPLAMLHPTARLGIVPQFGNGEHYLSWIHIDDIAEIYRQCIEDNNYHGILNINSGAVTYKTFAKAVKKAYRSPLPILPAPAFILKIALGEMSEMVLESTRMSSDKLRNLGFKFQYEDIESAIESLVRNNK